jgi:hypothetical protein
LNGTRSKVILPLTITLPAPGAFTVTVADWVVDPPVPVQASVNVVVLAIAAICSVPEVPRAPLQPPDAVHAVALVLLQVRVVACPAVIAAGLALTVTVGGTVPGAGRPSAPLPQPLSAKVPRARTAANSLV